MREEAIVARRAHVETFDGLDSSFAEHMLGGSPQVEVSPLDDSRTEARPVCSNDVLADLVAARADPRPDDRDGRAANGGHAHLLAEPSPVLVHVLGFVARAATEVERLERTLADAAKPRRESDFVRPGAV